MPLRDGPTPSPDELDALAECTPADMDRAAARFREAVAKTPRKTLRTILDADHPATDPAAGPIPDEG